MVEVVRQPPEGPSQVDRQSVTLSSLAPIVLHDSSGAPHVYHLDGERRITGADPAHGAWPVLGAIRTVLANGPAGSRSSILVR